MATLHIFMVSFSRKKGAHEPFLPLLKRFQIIRNNFSLVNGSFDGFDSPTHISDFFFVVLPDIFIVLRLPKEFVEASVTVWFVVLFLESSLVQLFQAKRAHEMLGMEFSEHGSDATTCSGKYYN